MPRRRLQREGGRAPAELLLLTLQAEKGVEAVGIDNRRVGGGVRLALGEIGPRGRGWRGAADDWLGRRRSGGGCGGGGGFR